MASFPARVITGAVFLKALTMGILVSLLGATTFVQSILLVLVSATATGIFGILIVVIQVHSERSLHYRMDHLEERATEIVTKSDIVKEQTQVIAEKVAPEAT